MIKFSGLLWDGGCQERKLQFVDEEVSYICNAAVICHQQDPPIFKGCVLVPSLSLPDASTCKYSASIGMNVCHVLMWEPAG